jgi:hypothetical protein
MRLRLDALLADLRDRTEAILAAIDADTLLLHRVSGDLVLSNASKALYTPVEEHQLYAKGIVYRRDPLRLVSLPLVKIYNVGEHEVTVADLAGIASEPGVRLRFLRKLDGSLLQVFRDAGRVFFTTRGMIEGARLKNDDDEDARPGFDYLAAAREMATRLHPRLLEDASVLEGRTLLFEMIHREARQVTNYGDRADLTLIACFDRKRFAYADYDELWRIAHSAGLAVVEPLSFPGDLAAQIEALLASMAGTDEEGAVLCFERHGEVIYRVKIKSPEYLQLMRLMAFCTYDRTVEFIDAHGPVETWDRLREMLQVEGRSRVPEEVLGFYRAHWDRFAAYLADLARLRAWAEARRESISEAVRVAGQTPGEFRKAFALRAVAERVPALVFAALDGRLDAARLRKIASKPEEAAEMLEKLGIVGTGG